MRKTCLELLRESGVAGDRIRDLFCRDAYAAFELPGRRSSAAGSGRVMRSEGGASVEPNDASQVQTIFGETLSTESSAFAKCFVKFSFILTRCFSSFSVTTYDAAQHR